MGTSAYKRTLFLTQVARQKSMPSQCGDECPPGDDFTWDTTNCTTYAWYLSNRSRWSASSIWPWRVCLQLYPEIEYTFQVQSGAVCSRWNILDCGLLPIAQQALDRRFLLSKIPHLRICLVTQQLQYLSSLDSYIPNDDCVFMIGGTDNAELGENMINSPSIEAF